MEVAASEVGSVLQGVIAKAYEVYKLYRDRGGSLQAFARCGVLQLPMDFAITRADRWRRAELRSCSDSNHLVEKSGTASWGNRDYLGPLDMLFGIAYHFLRRSR